MALDSELLEILVCPRSQGALELVELPVGLQERLVEKYRERFREDEPVVSQGLLCSESQLVYPVVSDIPILLEDEAMEASILSSSEPG